MKTRQIDKAEQVDTTAGTVENQPLGVNQQKFDATARDANTGEAQKDATLSNLLANAQKNTQLQKTIAADQKDITNAIPRPNAQQTPPPTDSISIRALRESLDEARTKDARGRQISLDEVGQQDLNLGLENNYSNNPNSGGNGAPTGPQQQQQPGTTPNGPAAGSLDGSLRGTLQNIPSN